MDKMLHTLKNILSEKKKAVIRGRAEGPRRPARASKEGFLGRTVGMKGKGGTGEQEAPEIPSAPKEPEEKKVVTEFENLDDWILSMVLVAIMHANPGMEAKDAIKIGREWMRRLFLPRTDYMWRTQVVRINRTGIRAEASKIRRELFKLI